LSRGSAGALVIIVLGAAWTASIAWKAWKAQRANRRAGNAH
jgi:hypothetical protein